MNIRRFALVCCAAATLLAASAADTSAVRADDGFASTLASPDGHIDDIGAALGEQAPLAGMQQAIASAEGRTTSSRDAVNALIPVAISCVALAFGLFALWRSRRRDVVANTDGLTGLKNRRRFDLDVNERERFGAEPTSMLMIDVDNFKGFNDTYGHGVGDAVLRGVGTVISTTVRRDDVAYRYGGEEFCVLLPNTDRDVAAAVGERIRLAIAEIQPSVPADPDSTDVLINHVGVTASVGVAAGPSAELANTIEQADAALYDAKDAGRNQVVVA